jgi:DNA-binding beta-propeller fold protein YncE
MKPFLRLFALGVAAGTLLAPAGNTRAQLLITGNDEKVSFDEAGTTVTHPPGKDTVSIIDMRDPTKPRIVANLPLMNSITGPPVNLAITPDQHLALIANSLDWVKDGEAWKGVPDNKIYVIDLTTSPPVQITTVEAGKQPSGMAINRAGTLALVANRAMTQSACCRSTARPSNSSTRCRSPALCDCTSGNTLRRRYRTRWQTCSRRQVRCQPGGAARYRWPEG